MINPAEKTLGSWILNYFDYITLYLQDENPIVKFPSLPLNCAAVVVLINLAANWQLLSALTGDCQPAL